MSARTLAASTIAALLWISAAAAASVTNRDDEDFKITVIEGDVKQDHVLKPSQVLEGICQKGCVIRLNDSENDEYELEGTENVSIEEGSLYYDGPDAPEEPEPDGDGGPARAPRQ